MAVIFTDVVVVTGAVVTANVVLVAPAGTVTEAGTLDTLVLPLVSVTSAPPVGAALKSVTVPLLPAPPVSTDGFRVIVASAGFTVSAAVLEVPL